MHEAVVRQLTVRDLEGALRLSSTAGWNQRLEDWRMLLRIAADGAFCADYGGEIVGTAIGIDYGSFGWIAMMLVDPAQRGRGLGARLLEAAMGALPPQNAIRLDATPMGRPLYERHGFVDETTLTRHVAAARSDPPDAAPPVAGMRPMTEKDVDRIAERGFPRSGGARRAVLRWILGEAPQYGRILEGEQGLQYCFGRPGRLFDQIGPVVADSPDAARALVTSVLPASQGRPLAIDAYDHREPFASALAALGFAAQRPLFRMCRHAGASRAAGEDTPSPAHDYAILGPEFA